MLVALPLHEILTLFVLRARLPVINPRLRPLCKAGMIESVFLIIFSLLSHISTAASAPIFCVRFAVNYGLRYTVFIVGMYSLGFSEGKRHWLYPKPHPHIKPTARARISSPLALRPRHLLPFTSISPLDVGVAHQCGVGTGSFLR